MTGLSGHTRAWIAGVLLALPLLATAACAGEDDDQPGFAQVTTTAEATNTPEPTATPTPEVRRNLIELNEAKLPPRMYMVPAGQIAAEPYRVFTGDGDCLNVRPMPGTTFQTDPRTCVPEGFLLWLYGDAVDVDGFTWRYALGEGWVATQYVKPDPASKNTLSNRVPSLVVSTRDGREEYFSRVEPSGKVTKLATIPESGNNHFMQGDANGTPYSATGIHGVSGSAIVFTNLETGGQYQLEKASFRGWSDDGKALVTLHRNGQELAYVVPGSDPVVLGPEPSGLQGFSWLPGGKSVIVTGEASAVYEFDTGGGGQRTVLPRDESRPYLGELSVSPDGKRILSSPFFGPLQLISLSDGKLQEFPRAPQQTNVGGRCGGASGRLSVWLDNNTVIWHESYAQKGFNGITIGNLGTTTRKLVPFFTLEDITRVDSKTVAFTTREYITGQASAPNSELSFPVTWILDVESGEARPVAVGSMSSRRSV